MTHCNQLGGMMRRSGTVKFPNSAQLFKFCQKVLLSQRGGKVHDQEIGAILDFNPSDCSHWKRGEKNVKSVFAMAKLSETLGVEATLIHDVASGTVGLDEAFFEYQESKAVKEVLANAYKNSTAEEIAEVHRRVESFVAELHGQSESVTAPLYLPEIIRHFSFVNMQPADMMDRLTRILRVKLGQYTIQYKKGELKPQTRMSMAKDLSRIIFEGERARFPELGEKKAHLVAFEEIIFIASLFVPKGLMMEELSKLDSRRNVVSELGMLFWVPKSLISFQMQDALRSGERTTGATIPSVTTGTTVPTHAM